MLAFKGLNSRLASRITQGAVSSPFNRMFSVCAQRFPEEPDAPVRKTDYLGPISKEFVE